MNDLIMEYMRHEANEDMLEKVKNGSVTLQDEELISHWLGANLVTSADILKILEAMNILLMEGMAQEYVAYFINKIRELANSTNTKF